MVGAFIEFKIPCFTAFVAPTGDPINNDQAWVRKRSEDLLLRVPCSRKTCHWVWNEGQKSIPSDSCLLHGINLPLLLRTICHRFTMKDKSTKIGTYVPLVSVVDINNHGYIKHIRVRRLNRMIDYFFPFLWVQESCYLKELLGALRSHWFVYLYDNQIMIWKVKTKCKWNNKRIFNPPKKWSLISEIRRR